MDWLDDIKEDEKETGWKFLIVGFLIYIGTVVWHRAHIDDLSWWVADARRIPIAVTTVSLALALLVTGAMLVAYKGYTIIGYFH